MEITTNPGTKIQRPANLQTVDMRGTQVVVDKGFTAKGRRRIHKTPEHTISAGMSMLSSATQRAVKGEGDPSETIAKLRDAMALARRLQDDLALQMLAEGYTTAQVADALEISQQAVSKRFKGASVHPQGGAAAGLR